MDIQRDLMLATTMPTVIKPVMLMVKQIPFLGITPTRPVNRALTKGKLMAIAMEPLRELQTDIMPATPMDIALDFKTEHFAHYRDNPQCALPMIFVVTIPIMLAA
jgi:hypothetical protein